MCLVSFQYENSSFAWNSKGPYLKKDFDRNGKKPFQKKNPRNKGI